MFRRRLAAVAAWLFALAAAGAQPALAQQAFSAMAPQAPKALHVEVLLGKGDATTRVELPAPDPGHAKALRERNSFTQDKLLEIGFGRSLARLQGADSDVLTWERVAGGSVARWEVASPGAAAVRIALETAALPRGAQLRFAGSADPATVYGPFAAEEALQQREYWSPVLEGERGTVELFVPEGDAIQDVRVGLLWVSHLIASLREGDLERKLGESQSCEHDLICLSVSSSALADTGRSVARMAFAVAGGGTGLCTGTLLATTSGPGLPYFYAANHCISTQATASTLTTHWFYDRTTCNSGSTINPAYTQLTGGATLLYNNATTDVLLLRLNTTPPSGVIYAGWNAAALTNGTPLVAVHHPAGDVKKVSLGSHGGFSAYGGGAGSTHIIALWNGISTGVTEGGSSGSGIFTAIGSPATSYQLRGGLHGGPSSCTATGISLRDYYSRFDNAYPSLAPYLAPSGCTYVLNPTSASPSASGGGASFGVTAGAGCTWTAASNAAFITTTSTGSGNGTVNYTVAANTGAARSGTVTVGGQTFTVNQAAGAGTPSNVLLNGDFEQGAVAWVQSGTYAIITNEPANAHGGSYDAWLGGYNSGSDLLYQDFAIPANASTATLRFWHRITTEETSTTTSYDILSVAIVNPGTGAAQTLATLTNLHAGAWTQSSSFDLSAYRGQTVRLRFVATTDGSLITNFRIDDVVLDAPVAANPPRMTNISTRMQVATGNNVMIGGFVIGGSGNKTVAIVATGPSLSAYGITNPLLNPTLTLVRSSDQAILATNDNWQNGANAAQLQASGFAPVHSQEAAILVSLPPGAYTAIVQGVGDTTGVAVIGVYEVDGPAIPLTNISTRGRVLTGNDVMIGGFVIQGTGPQTVAIVATGPSLAAFGITGALSDPMIQVVRSSDQAVMATNDDWQSHANASQLQAAGFSPTNVLEAAIYITLQPGAYTAIVSGFQGATGVGVIGVYRVN